MRAVVRVLSHFLCAVRRDIWLRGYRLGNQKPACFGCVFVFDSLVTGPNESDALKGIGIFTDETPAFLPVIWSQSKLLPS
jgi:hypothetical protein